MIIVNNNSMKTLYSNLFPQDLEVKKELIMANYMNRVKNKTYKIRIITVQFVYKTAQLGETETRKFNKGREPICSKLENVLATVEDDINKMMSCDADEKYTKKIITVSTNHGKFIHITNKDKVFFKPI